jgi:hypothetical protein
MNWTDPFYVRVKTPVFLHEFYKQDGTLPTGDASLFLCMSYLHSLIPRKLLIKETSTVDSPHPPNDRARGVRQVLDTSTQHFLSVHITIGMQSSSRVFILASTYHPLC